MKTNWKNFIAKTTFWFAVELLLNVTGLDNLADYSEFIFEKHVDPSAIYPVVTQSVLYPAAPSPLQLI